MYEEWREELRSIKSDLLTHLTISKERRDKGKINDGKRREFETRIAVLKEQLGDTIEVGNHLNNIKKNIQAYNVEHQNKVQSILDLAIREAATLVPDADVADVKLNHNKDGRVTIVNSLGQNVNLREGGGYRVTLGSLLRYACLKADPEAIPLMLFDESFFTLSDTTTDAVHPVFEAMKKDVTIICIEQRRNVMAGIVDREFTFKKGSDKNSTVTRTL